LIDEIGEARVVLGESTFETSIGQTISLMPLSDIPNVITTGLRWNLTGEGLAPGVRDGISNVAVSDRVTISSPTAPLVIYLHHG
jgi:thiamine pyrophosphokinase